MNAGTVRSSLASYAALGREPDAEASRKLAREAWHKHGLIVIDTMWLGGWADRRQAELLAEKAHGRRKVYG